MYPIVTGVKLNLSMTVSRSIVPEYFSFISLNSASSLVYILGVRNVFLSPTRMKNKQLKIKKKLFYQRTCVIFAALTFRTRPVCLTYNIQTRLCIIRTNIPVYACGAEETCRIIELSRVF